MGDWFEMPRGDRWYLVGLLVYTVIAFLPWAREIRVGGMALTGWLMAGLMVLSPVVALARLAGGRGPR